MAAQLLSPSSHAVRPHRAAYPTASDIALVVEKWLGVRCRRRRRRRRWWLWGGMCGCFGEVRWGWERYGSRRMRKKTPRGKSASINNQVTPEALQLLELPQRNGDVFGIALVEL